METRPTAVRGCVELLPRVLRDARGRFTKLFHETTFAAHGLDRHFAEQYCSVSERRVLRGLHFQIPPHDHAKVIYCVMGTIRDVAVDLRRGSPTFRQFASIELGGDQGNGLYLPRGLAHGFYVLSEHAVVVCKTTTIYAPSHDAGIRWDSAGIPWPDREPIISGRDAALPTLAEFDTPFHYGAHLR